MVHDPELIISLPQGIVPILALKFVIVIFLRLPQLRHPFSQYFIFHV